MNAPGDMGPASDSANGRAGQCAEEELRSEQERFLFALEAADMVAWDWDPTSDEVVQSRNAGRVLGLAPGGAKPQTK